MARHAYKDWNLPEALSNWELVQIALLMDIRNELSKISGNTATLQCPNAIAIPGLLRQVVENTKKPRKRRARK